MSSNQEHATEMLSLSLSLSLSLFLYHQLTLVICFSFTFFAIAISDRTINFSAMSVKKGSAPPQVVPLLNPTLHFNYSRTHLICLTFYKYNTFTLLMYFFDVYFLIFVCSVFCVSLSQAWYCTCCVVSVVDIEAF